MVPVNDNPPETEVLGDSCPPLVLPIRQGVNQSAEDVIRVALGTLGPRISSFMCYLVRGGF